MSRRELTRRAALKTVAGSVATVGVAGAASAQESTPAQVRPDWGGWLEGVDGGYEDLRGNDEVTVRVGAQGNGGAFAFAPAGVWIDPGTTVVWQWTGEGGAHNVVGESGPAASIDSGAPVAEAGYTFEHTFEKSGITTYYCAPHRSLGMKGAVAVGDDVPTVSYQPPSAGEKDEKGLIATALDAHPGASVLLLLYGVAGLGAIAVFSAGWVEDVRTWRENVAAAASIDRTAEAPEETPERELGHEEYDPYGTLSLVLLYLAIIVVMWLFMYFVEFLGNGPTIVG